MIQMQFTFVANVPTDLKDLIPRFLNNRKIEMANLKQAIEQSDFETIARIGHTMKGACGGYGFDELSVLGKTLEISAKAARQDELNELMKLYEKYIETVKIEYC